MNCCSTMNHYMKEGNAGVRGDDPYFAVAKIGKVIGIPVGANSFVVLNYCPWCGQKIIVDQDYSTKPLGYQLMQALGAIKDDTHAPTPEAVEKSTKEKPLGYLLMKSAGALIEEKDIQDVEGVPGKYELKCSVEGCEDNFCSNATTPSEHCKLAMDHGWEVYMDETMTVGICNNCSKASNETVD